MTRAQDRAESILSVAERLYGMITMDVVLALFPTVDRSVLVRLLDGMSGPGGALVPLRLMGQSRRKVWLTTRAGKGTRRKSGVAKYLSEAERRLIDRRHDEPDPWRRMRFTPPPRFEHHQMAGVLVVGYGRFGMTFDAEIDRSVRRKAPDGIAVFEEGRTLIIEVERMCHRSPSRWTRSDPRRGGDGRSLIDEIVMSLEQGQEHLVVAPRRYLHELAQLVEARARDLGYTGSGPASGGYWTLPLEDIYDDPTRWRVQWLDDEQPELLPVIAVTSSADRPLPGLRTLRMADPVRQRQRKRDEQQKIAAAQRETAAANAALQWGRAKYEALHADRTAHVERQRRRKRAGERRRRARRRLERRTSRKAGAPTYWGAQPPAEGRRGGREAGA